MLCVPLDNICRIAELQNCRIAELQNCRIAELPSSASNAVFCTVLGMFIMIRVVYDVRMWMKSILVWLSKKVHSID